MSLLNFAKTAMAGGALALVAVMGTLLMPPRSTAQDGSDDAARIQQGFAIAPVKLNLAGKNSEQVALVGLGSYFVNAAGDCDGCHSSGGPPNFQYLAGSNPYFLNQGPAKLDPSVYLNGGADFGPAIPFNVGAGVAYGSYVGPDIITRNLTPNKNGVPENGNTLSQFMDIFRTGVDLDHLHPTCTSPTGGPGGTPTPANCIPPPVDGSKLQIMPWPVFHNLKDRDIQAIYEYLSAIPCITGPKSVSDLPPPLQYAFPDLHNDCGN